MENKNTNTESCHIRATKGIRYQLKLIASQENINMQEALLMMINLYEKDNK
tara:strand:+ start:291 stop:443 length:153 start_codon:yes stop_codon:yes gene_type:complete